MNKDVARDLLTKQKLVFKVLEEISQVVRSEFDPASARHALKTIGDFDLSFFSSIVSPVFEWFPDLEQEFLPRE